MKPLYSDEIRWRAVLNRDASCDGAFVYGVLSTKIFCRPSCPSRRPQRSGVRFFETTDAATRAGFRACKRCRPQTSLSTQQEQVQRICELLEAEERPTSLHELGEKTGLSASHVQRVFKKAMGVSPREYAQQKRLQRAREKLHAGENVMAATFDSGFGSMRALYESAPSHLGMTPAAYGRGGAGATIHFDTAPCALGTLLVAATERGLCAVSLGDDAGVLEAELQREFFAANIHRAGDEFRRVLSAVLQLLENAAPSVLPPSVLPLDVRATAFQMRVWSLLQNIARGETRSYSQIADELGMPRGARAVARACASNPVALVVPCHRVVRESGDLSGYRWGIARKKQLLEKEAGEARGTGREALG